MEGTRLAYARLPHHCHNLPVAAFGQLQCFLQLLQLTLATDEAHQPPSGRDLQPRAQGTSALYFIDVDGLTDAFDLRRSQELKLKVTFGELVGVLAYHNRAAAGQTFHPRR